MSHKKTIIISTILSFLGGLIIGVLLTYYYGMKGMEENINLASELIYGEQSAFYSNRAYKAYLNEDPMLGIWALEGVVDEKTKLLDGDYKFRLFYDDSTLYADLMLLHARLSKLYKDNGNPDKAKVNEEKAIYYAKLSRYSGELNDISEIIKFVDRIDSNARKVEEN